MPTAAHALSLRVPQVMKERLNFVSKKMRRSRSSVVIEALERHLDAIQNQSKHSDRSGRFFDVMQFKGAGVALTGGASAEEIDSSIREIRGNE